MSEYEIILEKQFNYIKDLLEERRNKYSEATLTKEIGFEGNSPYYILKHAIIALHHFASHNFFPEEFGNRKDIFEDKPEDLVNEIITKYRYALNEFSRAIQEIDDQTYIEIKENIGNLLMHVIGHIGQAIRLQKMNIHS